MTGIDQLLLVARTYAEAERIDLKAVSSRVFDDSKKLPAIEAGADLTTRRYEAALQWFSDHWPARTPWPKGVRRPAMSAAEPA